MENLNSVIKKEAAGNGLLLGVILFVLGIITFYVMISIDTAVYMIIVVPIVFSLLLPLGAAIYLTIDLRKKIGGYWNFKQATTGVFIMCLVSFTLQSITQNLIFAKFIEPEMAQKTQNAVMRASTAMMEKSGASQEQIDQQTEKAQKQFDSQVNPTFGKTVQTIAISIIFIFVLSLIFGAIFKRQKPLGIEDAIDPAITDPTV